MITGIEHTGLVARDVDKICEFYEKFFDCKVNLQTWVKVKEDWRNRDGLLRNFGFDSSDFN